ARLRARSARSRAGARLRAHSPSARRAHLLASALGSRARLGFRGYAAGGRTIRRLSDPLDEPVLVPSPARERWLRRAGSALAALMVLLLAAIGAGGWYYADQIMARPERTAPEQGVLTAVSPRGTTATVRLTGDELAGT